MSDPKAAVQKVRDTHKAFLDNVRVMNQTHGAEYEESKERDTPLWRAYQAAQDELRASITEAFGVNIYDLRRLLGN